MKSIRILALLLALVFCLTACGSGSASTASSSGSGSSSTETATLPDEAVADVVKYLTSGAYTADTVVATVGDIDVTAAEVLYWTAYQQYSMTYYYYSNYGYSFSMTDDTGDGTTVGEYLFQLGLDSAIAYAVGAQKAADSGVSISADNAAAIASLNTDNIQSYGEDRWQTYVDAGLLTEADYSDEEKAAWILEHGTEFYAHSLMYYACTPEIYEQLITHYYAFSTLEESLFADGGEYAPTEETMNDYLDAYITDNGVIWGRCILFATGDAADDAAKAEIQAQAQSAYDQLSALSGDELSATFTDLQSQYDTSGYTAGEVQHYTTSDSLVDGYYSGLAALSPGQVGITGETDYGYFVLLRDADQTDDIYDTVKSNYMTSTFDSLIEQWKQDYSVPASDALMELDLTAFYDQLASLQTTLSAVDTVDTGSTTDAAS